MADSRSSDGGRPVASTWASFDLQSSFEAIKAPEPLRSSRTGSVSALVIPETVSDGPMARMITLLLSRPVIIKPPIMALPPEPTHARVEMLARDWAGLILNQMSSDAVALGPIALTVTLEEPKVLGLPVIRPDCGSSVNPDGKSMAP